MSHDEHKDDPTVEPPDQAVDAPQPGARKEMPLSPPPNRMIVPGLIVIAVVAAAILIAAYL